MNKAKILAVLATFAVVAVVGYWSWSGLKSPPVAKPASIVTTPPGWKQLDEGLFTLYAPDGSYIRKAQGNSGLEYGDIVGTNGCVRFKAGSQAAILVDKARHPDFVETPIVVDGHPAVLRKAMLTANEQQYWFSGCEGVLYLGLYVQGALPGGANLALEAVAPNEDALDDMMMVFKSVRIAQRG
jgi:hypothetical protein